MKKEKRIFLWILFVVTICLTGFAKNSEESNPGFEQTNDGAGVHRGDEYTFRKSSPDNFPLSSANIRNVYDYDPDKQSLFIGQVLALFGEPDYVTQDMEDLFSTLVQAEDKDGNILFLEIYCGPSGPAIGGPRGEEYERAADELAEVIMAAKPVDFRWECVYEDVGVTVIFGVENGKPYNESLFPLEWLSWGLEESDDTMTQATRQKETEPQTTLPPIIQSVPQTETVVSTQTKKSKNWESMLVLVEWLILIFGVWFLIKDFRRLIEAGKANKALEECRTDNTYIKMMNESEKKVHYGQMTYIQLCFAIFWCMIACYVMQGDHIVAAGGFIGIMFQHIVTMVRIIIMNKNKDCAYISKNGLIAAEKIYTQTEYQFELEQENVDNGNTYVIVCDKEKIFPPIKFCAEERIVEIKEIIEKLNRITAEEI